jgi:hypothetical protein
MIGAVEGGSPDPHPMIGCLDDGILFRMESAAEFVAFSRWDAQFLAETPDDQAVLQLRRSPIVTRRQNLLILNEDSPHLPPQASRTFGDEMGNVHEILFPRRSEGMNLLLLFCFQG